MKRALGPERIIDGLELKLVRLILDNTELRKQVDALTTANLKLGYVLERLRAGVLDIKDQSTETD